MQPLSPALYFRRNLVRTLPVLGVIALAVLGVIVVGVLAASQVQAPKRDFVDPARIFARITPRKRPTVNPNIAATLRTNPDVERVIRTNGTTIRGTSLMGSQSRPVRGIPENDLEWYLQATGMRLAEGRLPQGSGKEIALPTALLQQKGLHVGDMVGHDLDRDEWLPLKWTIVGRLDGPMEMGVATQAAMRDVAGTEALDVFAKPGRMDALDPYLQSFASEDVDVATIASRTHDLERETKFLTPILFAVNGVTIIVLSLAVGLLNQIYFIQRVPEYGLLLALGYRVSYLVRRTLIEALTLTVLGWGLGLGLSYSVSWLLRSVIFGPKGITLAGISGSVVASTIPIPFLIALFSLWTVIRRLVSLDPVSIVERRD